MIIYRLEITEPSIRFPNINSGVYDYPSQFDPIYDTIAEHLDGSYQKIDTIDSETKYMNKHPIPQMDMKLRDPWNRLNEEGKASEYVFGFHTLNLLLSWFSDYRNHSHLYEHVRIGVYEVPDKYYHRGTFQSVAKANLMKLVQVIDLGEL